MSGTMAYLLCDLFKGRPPEGMVLNHQHEILLQKKKERNKKYPKMDMIKNRLMHSSLISCFFISNFTDKKCKILFNL